MSESANGLGSLSMLELFRAEVETHAAHLSDGLLRLEQERGSPEFIPGMMRAAHSIKGAARIVGVDGAVRVAHAMEDCFVAIQQGKAALGREHVDLLLAAVDLLKQFAGDEAARPPAPAIERVVAAIGAMVTGAATPPVAAPAPPAPAGQETRAAAAPAAAGEKQRIVRVGATQMEHLMSLAGESLVQTRWLRAFADSLLRLQLDRHQLAATLARLQASTSDGGERVSADVLAEAQQWTLRLGESMAKQVQDFDLAQRRLSATTERLYREALSSRMRPFSDGVQGFRRMVRDLARALGKEVRFEILGQATPVDRDVLDRLEAPLTHLVRNALDHGLEAPEERCQRGKEASGSLRLEARHVGGVLSIIIADDGRGIDLEEVRGRVAARGLATPAMAASMSQGELLEFLFLPGFSTRDQVTELSGRGVGLDVLRTMLREVGGAVHIETGAGRGTRFELRLPLTLSVMRSLLFQVAGEPYALPLRRVERCLRLGRDEVRRVEDREYVLVDGENLGLIPMHEVLELKRAGAQPEDLSLVVIGQRGGRFGFQVERFLGERDLVVRPLDPRLGKTPDVSAASIMEDGAPLLILDADDLVRSAQALLAGGGVARVTGEDLPARALPADAARARARQRILVVDDSITVREVERRLLESRGYRVDVAVDGADGWRAVRAATYDLVITDVDMPVLDGIELVRLIRGDLALKDLPVMIVSYKDSAADRERGLEAGASRYLTKSSFHDERLLEAVLELIGEARR